MDGAITIREGVCMKQLREDIRVLTHAAIRLVLKDEHHEDVVIYCDPFHLVETTADADLILVTHAHYDHYSVEDIAKVRKSSSEAVYPASMREETGDSGIDDAQEHFLAWNESLDFRGIKITAIPAYNPAKRFHPAAQQWIGYLLDDGTRRIYIAGDTDITPEAEMVRCDVALLPIGGTYTMNAHEAATLAVILRPQLVIPTHYGSVAGEPGDEEVFRQAVGKSAPMVHVEIRMERYA